MFYNDAVEYFTATEADGAAIEQRVDSEFSNFVSPHSSIDFIGWNKIHSLLF
jgi:hypothetical protein